MVCAVSAETGKSIRTTAKGGKTIAIYHCSIKIISRGKAKSAVGSAAYRSGEKLTNEYDGMTHDYTRKGGVVHTEMLLPDQAPREYLDRSTLWNAVEKVEKARNSQLAREVEISLPNELTLEQNIALAKEFVQKTFVDKGMCADVCIHNPSREQPNIHAHIMLTMRPILQNGEWGEKQKKEYILDSNGNKIYDKLKRTYKCKSIPTTDWNSQEKAEEWRKAWADFQNTALEKYGFTDKVDHRSFERQGVPFEPTVHMGVSATQMERRGIRTEVGDINRAIKKDNSVIAFILRRIKEADEKIHQLEQQPKEEDLVMKLLRYFDNGQKFAEVRGLNLSSLKKAAQLQDVSKAVAFLQENDIKTMAQLSEKLSASKSELLSLKSELAPKQKRAKELIALLENYETYKQFKAVYAEYESITKKRKKDDFYEIHRREITLFIGAKNTFKSMLPDGAKITPKAWKSELDKLTADFSDRRKRIATLQHDVEMLETIQMNMDRLERFESKKNEIQRKHSSELE